MQAYPHHYHSSARATKDAIVSLDSPGLPTLGSAAPTEFGGPGNLWSPETLLVAAVADCFVLSFKAIARASTLEWTSLECQVEGILDRIDKTSRFTQFNLYVELEVPVETDKQKALQLLEKAESSCLITSSLIAETRLDTQIRAVQQ